MQDTVSRVGESLGDVLVPGAPPVIVYPTAGSAAIAAGIRPEVLVGAATRHTTPPNHPFRFIIPHYVCSLSPTPVSPRAS